MKQNIKRSAIRSIWIGVVTGLVVLCFSAINQKKVTKLTGIDVRIEGFEEGNLFLTGDDVREELNALIGPVENRMISGMDITMLEDALYRNPFVEHADVYISSDGRLSVTLHQREPLYRVFDKTGGTCYIDRDGMKIPVSPNFTARVVVVTGDIEPVKDVGISEHARLSSLHHLISRIENDKFLHAMVEQIDVDHNGEVTLIPKIGDTRIEFGKCERVAYKLESLKSFYTQVVKIRGWDQFENINLAYDGQIVCKRKAS